MAAFLPIDTLRRHAVQPAFVAHDIAGRLRIVVPYVQDDPHAAVTLCAVLRGIDGVADVQANATAGSVTVHYDSHTTARARVLDALGHPQPGQPRSGAVANALADAVAKHLADAVLHALLAALV
jgi:copper chaperone CopZ